MEELIKISFSEFVKVMQEKDEGKKKELEEKMKSETMPSFLKLFEKILLKNGGKFYVGNNVSRAPSYLDTNNMRFAPAFGL